MGYRGGRARFGRELPARRTTALSVVIVAILLVGAPVTLAAVGTATGVTTATAANFQVSDLQSPAEVDGGDTLTVTATITNTGDATATKFVELRLDYDGDGTPDDYLTGEEVQLAPGESKAVSLSFRAPLGPGSAGSYVVGMFSPDDSATTTLEVLERATFELSDFEAPDVLPAGDTLNASVTVENVDTIADTKSIELGLDNIPIGTQNVSLAPGESKTVKFAVTETSGFCCITSYPATRTWSLDVAIPPDEQENRERIGKGLLSVPGERILRVEGTGEYTTYEVTTNYAFIGGKQLEARDQISADTKSVSGGVTGGTDRYVIKGSILHVQVNGPDDAVTIYNGDREIDTSNYGDEDTVKFVGDGNGSTYAFTADGITGGKGLGPADGFTDEPGSGDDSGSGFVSGGSDLYTFGGSLRTVSIEPGTDVRVLLNGEEIDPYELGRGTTITFVGNGTTGTYGFTASNEIVDRRRLEAGTDDLDSFRRATGVVRGGIDEFVYTGELERLDVDPSVTVYVDGEEVDPDSVGAAS